MITCFWMLYAYSLLKHRSKSGFILTISLFSVEANIALLRLELSLPGGNRFDFSILPLYICKMEASTVLSYMYIPGNTNNFWYPHWSQLLSTDTRGCQFSSLNRPAICLVHVHKKAWWKTKKQTVGQISIFGEYSGLFGPMFWSKQVCFAPNKNHSETGGSFVTFLLPLVVVRFGCCQSRCLYTNLDVSVRRCKKQPHCQWGQNHVKPVKR